MTEFKVCATGTSGLIGRNLSEGVKSIEGNLLEETWRQKEDIQNINSLIHLAGVVGERNVLRDEEYAHRVNVYATTQLAKFIRDESQATFLFVSSAHVYKSKNTEISEQDPMMPLNKYGEQKALAEVALHEVFRGEPDRLKILRVFSILNLSMQEGTLGWAIENARSQPVNFGEDIRDFLSAKQVARIIEKLASCDFSANVVNICTGIPTTIKKALTLLLDIDDDLKVTSLCRNGTSKHPVILGNPTLVKSILGEENLKWEFYK